MDESQSKAEMFLKPVNTQNSFYLNNDGMISSLEQLGQVLHAMNKETFAYHCHDNVNDFAAWVRDTILDEMLAKAMDPVRNKDQMADLVSKRVEQLKQLL